LVAKAKAVIGAEKAVEIKLDTLDEAAIKRAVIQSLSPEAKLDGKDAAYIGARYDQALEQAAAAPHMQAALLAATNPELHADCSTGPDLQEVDRKKRAEAWRTPLMHSKK
jgi:hypothetical protein